MTAQEAGPERGPGPVVPVVAPALLGAALLVLFADRALGLTAFAVAAGSDRTGALSVVTLLADVVSALVVGAVLVVGEVFGRPRRSGRRVAVLLVAALAALQLGAAAAESITGTAVAVDLYLGRALLLTGALLAARTVLASLVEHRAATRALRAASAEAESLGEAGRAALTRVREDVSGRVLEVLHDALDALAVGGGADGARAPATVTGARLRRLADDVLRPLSHRLAGAPTVGLDAPPAVDEPRWRDTFAAVARRPVIPVRQLVTIAVLLALLRTFVTDQAAVGRIQADAVGAAPSGITATVDLAGFAVSLGEILLVLVLTWWAAARVAVLVERHRGRLGPAGAWVMTNVALLVVAMLTLGVPALLGLLGGTVSASSLDPVAVLASFVPLVVVTLGVTILAAVAQERLILRNALAEQGRANARVAARTQAVLAHEQQRLARTLHAEVQAAVNAAGLLLDRAAQDDAVTPTLVDDVADRIADAVERFLRGSSSTASLTDRLSEVRMLWAGVCAVDVDVPVDVAARLERDVIARDLLVDLVAEACANAAVHGRARHVTVGLALGDDGAEALLTVVDDGLAGAARDDAAASRSGSPGGGLGSAVLRASCTRFSLEVGDQGSTLVASVPLA